MLFKNLAAAALLAVSLGAAAQIQYPTLKPCFVQVAPTLWVDMNEVLIIMAQPDGSKLIIQFKQSNQSIELPIPADQALNYVRRAVSYYEQCRKS